MSKAPMKFIKGASLYSSLPTYTVPSGKTDVIRTVIVTRENYTPWADYFVVRVERSSVTYDVVTDTKIRAAEAVVIDLNLTLSAGDKIHVLATGNSARYIGSGGGPLVTVSGYEYS